MIYSINHCRAIDADYNRDGVGGPNEEENVVEGAADNDAAAAAQSEESEGGNVNLFGDEVSSENDVYGMEEEEE